jgi:excisionase family DNA binding protein
MTTLGYDAVMQTLARNPNSQVEIPPASVALNPSWESDWGHALLHFVRSASLEGKTVTVSVNERMLTPREAAGLADVGRTTILRRIEDGTINAAKRGSHWRIPESEIERYRRHMWVDTVAALADDF